MKRERSRKSKTTQPFEIICHVGDELRQTYGTVRYTDVIFFNGRQWTRKCCWERWDGKAWIEIADQFFAHQEPAKP